MSADKAWNGCLFMTPSSPLAWGGAKNLRMTTSPGMSATSPPPSAASRALSATSDCARARRGVRGPSSGGTYPGALCRRGGWGDERMG